jgi:hypothetical protein
VIRRFRPTAVGLSRTAPNVQDLAGADGAGFARPLRVLGPGFFIHDGLTQNRLAHGPSIFVAWSRYRTSGSATRVVTARRAAPRGSSRVFQGIDRTSLGVPRRAFGLFGFAVGL